MTIVFDMMLNVQQAYHEGKARTGDVLMEDQTQAYLWMQIQKWFNGLPQAEGTLVAVHHNLNKAIIQAVRKGELMQAAELIAINADILASSQLSPHAQYICKSQLEAAAAYLKYKDQCYDQAIAHLREALTLSACFEERNPELTLVPHLHRITLIGNWVRVLAQHQMCREAISLGFQVLDYLERKVPAISAPTAWDSSKLAACPVDVLNLFFQGATIEIIGYITGADVLVSPDGPVPVRALFTSSACQHIQSDNCHLSSAAHDWINMKQALLAGDSSHFLALAAKILGAGPNTWPTLWYAAAVELIVFSRHYRDACPASFQDEIIGDALAWKRLPPRWRSILMATT